MHRACVVQVYKSRSTNCVVVVVVVVVAAVVSPFCNELLLLRKD